MGFTDPDAPPPSWVEVRPPASEPAHAPEPGPASAASEEPTRGPQGRGRAGALRGDGATGRGRGRAKPPPPDKALEGAEPDAHDVARQIVLRQLTNSPKSRAQLEEALAKRECDPDVAASVLDRMEEVGLVDDEAYAGMLVRSQQAGRGLARRALAQTLRQKGVSDEVAEFVLDEVDPAEEEDRARELVDRRLRRLHGLEVVVQQRRLAGMLARKGYPLEVSMRVIREALAATPEHLRD